MPAVHHIRCKLQDPDAPPKADGSALVDGDALAAIREATVGHLAPTFVCCDINQVPTEAVRVCLRALPVLAPGAVIAVTAKLLRRGVAGNAELVRQAKELLSAVCDTVEEHWLFANT